MGVVVQGPWQPRSQEETGTVVTNDVVVDDDTSSRYPWYALSAPKGIESEEYSRRLVSLKKLANLAGSTGILRLPDGWSWDPNKIQPLIDQLNRIARLDTEEDEEEKEEESPDDPEPEPDVA